MDRGAIWRVWLPLVVVLCMFTLVIQSSVGAQGHLRWLGCAIALIGFAGIITARYTLGRSFSVKAKATALVTTGIYSRIRNPIYLSGAICVIGVAIMLSKFYLLSILIVIIPMQILRARREARVLEEKFGEEYRRYRSQTWF
jgi:protein-S-isoprenylcysteine O-methyltransferase Ste14